MTNTLPATKRRLGWYCVCAAAIALLDPLGTHCPAAEPPPQQQNDDDCLFVKEWRERIRGIPPELIGVQAEWQRDKNGQIVGVDFDSLRGEFGPRVQRDQFEHLLKLPKLQCLRIPFDHVTDEWMPVIGKLVKLTELNLSLASVTNDGVEHLRPLKDLRVLDLSEAKIDDSAMEVITKLSRLEELNLHNTNVTDFGVVELMKLERLRALTIGNKQDGKLIGRSSEGALCNMKSLRKLDIWHTSFDAEGVAVLKKFLPDCEIVSRR